MPDWQELYQESQAKRKQLTLIKWWLRDYHEYEGWEDVAADDLATAIEELAMNADEIAEFIVMLINTKTERSYDEGYLDGLNDTLGIVPDDIREIIGWQ